MEGYARIAEAFRLLADLSLPLDLGAMELACINAHARQLRAERKIERERQARELLARVGYKRAAEILGCCDASVYNMAARAAERERFSKKLIEPADV